jgi:hypothetical protein
MVVFPNATAFYAKWADSLRERGVNIRLNTPLQRVVSRDRHGVRVILGSRIGNGPETVYPQGSTKSKIDVQRTVRVDRGQPDMGLESEEHFDEIVFCILADTAKELLGKNASMSEWFVLGNTRWSDDITVTHNVSDVSHTCFLL